MENLQNELEQLLLQRSKEYNEDISGQMPWCLQCPYRTSRNTCQAKTKVRNSEQLCAKAKINLENKKGDNK